MAETPDRGGASLSERPIDAQSSEFPAHAHASTPDGEIKRVTTVRAQCVWSLADLAEGVALLARRAGLAPQRLHNRPSASVEVAGDSTALSRYVDATATAIGIEAEPLSGAAGTTFAKLLRVLPVVVHLPTQGGFLLVLEARGATLTLISRSATNVSIAAEELLELLTADYLRESTREIRDVIERAEVAPARSERVCRALMAEEQALAWMDGIWSLQLAPSAPITKLAQRAGIPRALVELVFAHAAQSFLWIVSWWIIGNAVLRDRLDTGWLWAWALTLATMLPFRVWASWSQGKVAVLAGSLLKRKLLYGALNLDPDDVRKHGSGQLLGSVNESENMESLALSGGFGALLASIELIGAAVVLSMGAHGFVHVLLLLVWVAAALAMARRFFIRLEHWSTQRIDMTHDLVEKMLGHRTRRIQATERTRHDGEDETLTAYYLASRRLDQSLARFLAFLPRGWLLVGALGIVLPFLSRTASIEHLAVSAGGILLSYGALTKLSSGLLNLGSARVSWKAVSQLYEAASSAQPKGAQLAPEGGTDGDIVLEASDIWFRHTGRPDYVLKGCSIEIRSGDQILLEGPSGCGKSTLGAILGGMRKPSSGLVLASGLDLHTLGMTGWRERVQTSPQFHDNHIFTGTLLFNILMGRSWPPKYAFEQVTAICYELGLGPLIERMPGGLMQMVGESGWQLSHGEKSRVFLARALIQGTDLVELDESFAALDPETLQLCLQTARQRAKALLVIAHP